MHELEFLPDWYPQWRRRRQIVRTQGWLATLVVVALAMWLVAAQRNVRSAEASIHRLNIELAETDDALDKLNDLLQLQRQWRQQDQIIARLGLHVETTRMLTTLAAVMPAEMAMQTISFQVEERQPTATTLARARDAQNKKEAAARWLNVRMVGVAPSDIEVANFLARLSNIPFFERVSMTYSRDRVDRGYIMREFEVTFALNLGGEGGG